MIKGHRIDKFETAQTFIERIKNFDDESIECTNHTLFRLSEKQRKAFKCEELKKILLNEVPLKVGIQQNGNHAVYYSYKQKSEVIKIIINIKPTLISIITFYLLDAKQVPRR